MKNKDFDPAIMMEFVCKLNRLANYFIENNFYFAFDPRLQQNSEYYGRNMQLLKNINNMLNSCGVNIKSRGYSYLTDALCIVYDHKSLDICLEKEVYSLISDNYRLDGTSNVEHNIRNCIKSAYERSSVNGSDHNLMAEIFGTRPSNKVFIMRLGQLLMEQMAKEKQTD